MLNTKKKVPKFYMQNLKKTYCKKSRYSFNYHANMYIESFCQYNIPNFLMFNDCGRYLKLLFQDELSVFYSQLLRLVLQ